MDILVYVKETPDTESSIRVRDGKIDFSEAKFAAGTYDEFAVEESIRIRDERGGKITLVCYGDERASKTLNAELAKGPDELLLIDEFVKDVDSLAVGELLANASKSLGFDIILSGWKSNDHDDSSTSIIVARKLGIPHVAYAVKIEIAEDGKSAIVHRAIEGSVEVIETPLPAVITCQKGLNEPRYAKLTGIMKAKKKPHHVKKLADFSLSVDAFTNLCKAEYTGFHPPPEKEPGKILDGDGPEAVQALIKHLKEDEKVI